MSLNAVRGDDGGAGQQPGHVGRRAGLARVRSQRLEVGREDPVGAEQRLDAHGRRQVGHADQRLQVVAGEREHAEHAVGAVDEGEALLGGQPYRLETGRRQRRGGVGEVAVRVAYGALAHQGQRAVRERCEVARAAERAVLVDHRRDAGVEHPGVGLDRADADPGVTAGEGAQPEQHQPADDLALDLGTGAGGVRADERALELLAQLGGDVPVGQGAEAGRDAVGRDLAGGEGVDPLTGGRDGGERLVGEDHLGATAGDRDDLVEGQRRRSDEDGVRHALIEATSPVGVCRTLTTSVRDPGHLPR